MTQLVADDKVHFGDDENSVPCIKKYLTDSEKQTPYSVFYQDGRGASKRLRKLMDGNIFEFPKDELVIQKLVEMVTKNNDAIVDFFAGSSTTAHAVLLQNAVDGANRRFIMVQIAEETDERSAAFEAGYSNIAQIAKERICRAGRKILAGKYHEGWRKDIGFRVLKVDTSNMSDVYYAPECLKQEDLLSAVESVKLGRSDPEDLLFQVLLELGIDPTSAVRRKTIQGKAVFLVGETSGDLLACFDSGVDEKLIRKFAEHKPARAVFRDSCFASDAAKINIEQIFRQLSPDTLVKSI